MKSKCEQRIKLKLLGPIELARGIGAVVVKFDDAVAVYDIGEAHPIRRGKNRCTFDEAR